MGSPSSSAIPGVSRLSINQLLVQLSAGRAFESSRRIEFYEELKAFIDRARSTDGTPAQELINSHNQAHTDGLSEVVSRFLDQPKDGYRSLGHYHWPDNSISGNKTLCYSSDKEQIEKLLVKLSFCRNGQQQRNRTQREKRVRKQGRVRVGTVHAPDNGQDQNLALETRERTSHMRSLKSNQTNESRANPSNRTSEPQHREDTPDSVFGFDFSRPKRRLSGDSKNEEGALAVPTPTRTGVAHTSPTHSATVEGDVMPSRVHGETGREPVVNLRSAAPTMEVETEPGDVEQRSSTPRPETTPSPGPSTSEVLREVFTPACRFPSPEASTMPREDPVASGLQPLYPTPYSRTAYTSRDSVETPRKSVLRQLSTPSRVHAVRVISPAWERVRYFVKKSGYPVEWKPPRMFMKISFAEFRAELCTDPRYEVPGDVEEFQIFLEGVVNPMDTRVATDEDFSAMKAVFDHYVKRSIHDTSPAFDVGDSSSTASFEKTLSTLSTKITTTQSKLDRLRSNARRVKVLWTLYLTFAYLVYGIVVLIVVGYHNMGPSEWSGLAGGPVLIYGVRTLIITYFNFRIDTTASRLKEQQAERAKTIQKLKDATKYDSTLELIEKYGGAEGKPKGKKKDGPGQAEEGGKDGNAQLRDRKHAIPGRTNMAPPPTANIQRREGAPSTPQPLPGNSFPPPPPQSNDVPPEALYAPNADFEPDGYVQSSTARQSGPSESHWYDRIFDVLLGDDETAPKNRIVLICQACRLVNGQAPPGTKVLADLGVWKCMACGAQNGEMDEGRRIVREVLGNAATADEPANVEDSDEPTMKGEEIEHLVGGSEDEAPLDGPAASVRKRRGKAKR
ncbi:Endoplasmic reticulum junction formation protein lunapark [Paramyrothecium foliicola]|nr:Endoplasmic reticulum junction formation protein lunapark [Paramyrothecium foliicola]